MVMETEQLPRNRTELTVKRPSQRKRTVKFGTWNILSWYRTGAAIQAIKELESRHMDITAIQEIRWTGNGNLQISRSHVFYSGKQDDKHEYGTGFVVAERMMSKIISFRPINERLCCLRCKGRWYNLSLISAYAPTEEAEEETKDTFYEQLDTLISETPKQDMLLLCGDFNAKVGREEVYKPAIGLHSLHPTSNDNGTRLIQQATSTSMMIKSTMFEHKDIHKQTWISNDGRTRNQIDHVLVNSRYASNVLDVRSLRGADGDTDHILVGIKIRFRLSCQRESKTNSQIQWDVNKLTDNEIRQKFQTHIEEKLSEVRQEHNNVEEKWKNIKHAITAAAEKEIGRRKKGQKKRWWDDECQKLIEERRKARMEMLENPTEETTTNFSDLRKRVRKLCRQKKRHQEQEAVNKIENTFNTKNIQQFYKEVNIFKAGFRPRTGNILKTPDNTLITQPTDIVNAWKQHFQDLLNIRDNGNTSTEPFLTADLPTEEPTFDEVTNALTKLKNNKAPGKDNIPAEFLKNGGEMLHRQIYGLILQIWNDEKIPEEWKESIIIPIHKKGDKLRCANYRGISLIDSAYKILSIVILHRLTPLVENILGDYQCGFRKNRSTTDQIFTIRQMLEKCWEFNKSLHNLFIDYKQAYDSINRIELWSAMTELSIPQKLIRLTKMCVCGSRSRVRVENRTSEAFNISNGLRQGDALSPLLFNIALEKAVRTAKITWEMFTQNGPKLLLAFADDIDIIDITTLKVKEQFVNLEKESQKMGLRINEDKTKYMCIARKAGRDRVGQNITMGDFNFERVNSFKYLGTIITEDNDISEEIKARLQSGNRCMYALNKLLASKNISRASKIAMYKTIIRPIVTYGSETWTITKANEMKIKAFERKVLRKIYGPIRDPITTQYRRRTNKELEELYKDGSIVQEIKAGRLRWAGHVHREPDTRMVKLAWETNPAGKRPLGRPRMRWRDNIKSDLEVMGEQFNPTNMLDRKKWKKIVQSAKTQPGL